MCSEIVSLGKRKILQRTSGYTLIEVLVATVIFSAMIGLATMAFDQSLKQYRGLVEKGVNFWDHARNLALYKSFSCASDYYVAGGMGNWFPYFHGSQDLISYVTLSPLTGDLPVVVWIVRDRLDNGLYDIIYYELPVYTKTQRDLDRDYMFGDYKKGQSLRLLERVQNLEVSFYGWDVSKKTHLWTPDYEGQKRLNLPLAVKIAYLREGKKGAWVFGTRTDTTRKAIYNEIYGK